MARQQSCGLSQLGQVQARGRSNVSHRSPKGAGKDYCHWTVRNSCKAVADANYSGMETAVKTVW